LLSVSASPALGERFAGKIHHISFTLSIVDENVYYRRSLSTGGAP
jgi:hypothetical protein